MPNRPVTVEVKHDWQQDWAAEAFGVYLICLGFAVLLGGDGRLSYSYIATPQLAGLLGLPLREMLAGMFLLPGLFCLFDRTRGLALAWSTVTLLFFTIDLCRAAAVNESQPVTGPVTYGFLAVLSAWLLVTRG